MSTLKNEQKFSAYATDVKIDNQMLTIYLKDGRILSVPIDYFPRLSAATSEQRNNWRLIGRGQGICWEDIDEDLSVEGLLRIH